MVMRSAHQVQQPADDALISAAEGAASSRFADTLTALSAPGAWRSTLQVNLIFNLFTQESAPTLPVKPPRPGSARDPKNDEIPCEDGETMMLAP